MPSLFNQTNKPLSWKLSGQAFTCDPWGSVDVPREYVDPCKKLGLPLAETPIAPELRAARRVEEERAAASDDVFSKVQADLKDALAAKESANAFSEEQQKKAEHLAAKVREALTENERLKGQLKELAADKKAAEDLLGEESRKAALAEERAQKAEAILAERKKQQGQGQTAKKS